MNFPFLGILIFLSHTKFYHNFEHFISHSLIIFQLKMLPIFGSTFEFCLKSNILKIIYMFINISFLKNPQIHTRKLLKIEGKKVSDIKISV